MTDENNGDDLKQAQAFVRDRVTRFITKGREPQRWGGSVNPPVVHASTILYPDLKTYLQRKSSALTDPKSVVYGRIGTMTTQAFEEAVADLEGGDRAVNYPSGLAAIVGVLTAFTKADDHLLVADNVYAPTRHFCDNVLGRYGVNVEYFDPMVGAGIAGLLRPETSLVVLEIPGSHSFEVCNLSAIAERAHHRGVRVAVDNTWAAGYYLRPLEHGADIVIQAATKYIVAHSDAMLGVAVTREALYAQLKATAMYYGTAAGPDDCYLGLRGLRTLDVRMPRHFETGLRLAEWLMGRDEVETVRHPALDVCPGHDIWKRDFTGASGLFGVVLKDFGTDAVRRLVDGMELYGLGDSWGGYESLLVPSNPAPERSATAWPYQTPGLRIHAGLEAFEDLRDDLAAGLDRLRGT